MEMSDNKKKEPGIIKKATNFAKAVQKHAKDGFKDVSLEQYIERIDICNKCPLQKDGNCLECGCVISKKAWWRSEDCPKDKWPKQ